MTNKDGGQWAFISSIPGEIHYVRHGRDTYTCELAGGLNKWLSHMRLKTWFDENDFLLAWGQAIEARVSEERSRLQVLFQ